MLTYFFPKINRLLRSRDFRLCAHYGEERVGRFMHVQIRKTASPDKKLGLTVSRKYGKATHRNRFKRLIREAFRLSQHDLPSHIHIAVRPRSSSLEPTLNEIQKELMELVSLKCTDTSAGDPSSSQCAKR